jgi:hypothetical protein
MQDSVHSSSIGESKHLGYYSVQTIIRCLVKMKPEQKTFQPSAEEIESFLERNSEVPELYLPLPLSLWLRVLIRRPLLKKKLSC